MSSSQSPLADSGGDNVSQDTIPFGPILQVTGLTKRVFSGFRLAQAALYGVQALLAYVLMLIVMTFNGNLILSIVAGEAVGYLLFTGTPLVDSHLSNCC
ncbi:Ctr copper transporter family protein [Cooperia oncophora]